MLRSPLLPFDEIFRPLSGSDSADPFEERKTLLDIVERPLIRRAISLASPSLDSAIEGWKRDPLSRDGQRTERALTRYVHRIASRPTPFGLFSGCSLGFVAKTIELELDSLSSYRRRSRLDMGRTVRWRNRLLADSRVGEHLCYLPNPTLYQVAGDLRYMARTATGDVSLASDRLEAVRSTVYLEHLLASAGGGTRRSALVEAMLSFDSDLDPADVDVFVDHALSSQLLLPNLDVPLTEDPLECFLSKVSRDPQLDDWVQRIEQLREHLKQQDRTLEGCSASPVFDDSGESSGHGDEDSTPPDKASIQVDLFKPAKALTLGGKVLQEIERGVKILQRLEPTVPRRLDRFSARFVERFGTAEVGLLEALDDEHGVGYGASRDSATGPEPLLAGLQLGSETIRQWPEDTAHKHRLTLLSTALQQGRQEIELSNDDIELLSEPNPLPLPNAFAVRFMIAAASAEAVRKGQFEILLISIFGPSGARTLARFADLDSALQDHLQCHLEREEAADPEAIYAEIVHLPEHYRHGNVMVRPQLRQYEIPVLGFSSQPLEQQIWPSDLGVSVIGGEVRLRCRKRNRWVIPRMSTAHAYGRIGSGLYRFLCDLQDQGKVAHATWDWGALAGSAFLPRVRCGRLVLSRARWRLGRSELKVLERGGQAALLKLWQAKQWPRFLLLDKDNMELVCDVRSSLSVEAFLAEVRGSSEIDLVELFPGPEQLPLEGPEGRFVHEIHLPFETAEPPASRLPPSSLPFDRVRSRTPGSDWLYLRLFCGPATADRVLIESLAEVIQELSADALRGWFFLRFDRPDWHLRLRLRGEEKWLLDKAFPALRKALEPWLDSGVIRKMSMDTYDREIERYGGEEGLEIAERWFHADSQAALEILSLLKGASGQQYRWRIALLGTDRLLDDFGFSLREKLFTASELHRAQEREHQPNAALRRQLGRKMRTLREDVDVLLEGERSLAPPWLKACLEILDRRSKLTQSLGRELEALEDSGRLSRNRMQIAASLAHLQQNRLLRSAQRRQELVLYDMLHRAYRARAGRLEQQKGRAGA